MNERETSDRSAEAIGISPIAVDGVAAAPAPDLLLAAARREIADLHAALAAGHARERALAHELQHRVRNVLAVIRSIYRRSRESGAGTETFGDDFADHFAGRLDAVARFQSRIGDQATPDASFPGVELEDMLRDELLEGQCLDGPRCTIDGPSVRLRHDTGGMMGLVFHELTVNSIKYGAIGRGGRLAIDWTIDRDGPHPLLRFRWIEQGIAIATPAPRPWGFGRHLIEEALPYQLGATTTFDLRPGGVECLILLPLPDLDDTAGPAPGDATDAPLLPSEAG